MNGRVDDNASRTRLIGREAELARIVGLFKQAETGRGAAALVLGVGGVGKSRLVSEVSARTASMGALVVATQSSTFDAGVPYALLSGLVDDLPSDAPDSVATVVQQIRSEIGQSANGESGRRNNVVSLADLLLRELTSQSPLVIVADDLHLADDDSLALLTRLSRTISRTRTMLLGTARIHGAYVSASVPDLISFLERTDIGTVIDLGALDVSETRSVVREILGTMPDDELTSFVFESSRGNPFFTSEVVRSLSRSDRIRCSTSRAHLVDGERVPQSHTSLIHRFFEVGSIDTQVARVLSVFGRIELERLDAIAAVTGISSSLVRECFDRLVAAGLLQHDGRNGFAFAHSLLRDSLYDDIGPAEQRRLHRSIAEFFMAERDRGAYVDSSDLAAHVAASAEHGDHRAISILVEAGHRVASVAPLVAASWFDRAANLVEDGSPQAAILGAERAHALFRASRPVETVKAAEVALAGLEPGRLRDRTICDVVNSLYISGDLHEAIAFIEKVGEIRDLPHSVQAQYEHFRAQLGLSSCGRCDRFLGIDFALDTQPTVTLAHDMLHSSTTGRLDVVARGIAMIDALAPMASGAARFALDSVLAMTFLTFEDVVSAKAVVERNARTGAARSNLSLSALFETSICTLQFMYGEWDECLRYSDDILWQMESNGIRIMESFLRSSSCLIQAERGEIRASRELARTLSTPCYGMKSTVESAIARVDRAVGHPERAVERLEALLRLRTKAGITVANHLILEELAQSYYVAGRQREACSTVDRLRDEWANSPYVYVECRANLVYGGIRRDIESLERAARIAEHEGFVFEAGRSRLMLAECGVDERANFETARDAFDSLAAMPWRQHALAGLRRLGVSVPRAPRSGVDGLSEAESAIAKLVAQGMTNKQVAASLHYSVKTVEVYLTRIYAKTNTTSRLDLARAFDRGAIDIT